MSTVEPYLKKDSARLVDLDEIERRCDGAVRLAFRGADRGHLAHDEARAQLVMEVWEGMPKHAMYAAERRQPTSLTGKSPTYSKKRAAKSKDAIEGMQVRASFPRECVPDFSKLVSRAYDLRKAYDRRRAYENAAAPVEFDAFQEDAYENAGRTHGVTMRQARRMALAMLDDLGYRPLRRGDLPLYVLAYSSARYATLHGLGYRANGEHGDAPTIGEQLAGELDLKPAAYRKALQRAVERMPRTELPARADDDEWPYVHRTHLRHRYVVALDLADTGGVALKPSRSRVVASELERDPRTKLDTDAPITERTGEPQTAVQPSWTQTLTRTQAARLERLAELSVGKAARERKIAEERAVIRQQAADDALEDARRKHVENARATVDKRV